MEEIKIKYLKTTEEFVFLNGLRLTDFNLVSMIENSSVTAYDLDMDDETFEYVRQLQKSHYVSFRTLMLAKRQAHLRKLNRVKSSWISLSVKQTNNPWGRPKKAVIDKDRLDYLKANFEEIAANCIRHDWFSEYLGLYHDVYPEMKKSEVIKKYKAERKNKKSV